ncbi:hypothetical protein [Pseudomonas sp. NPDC089734]|uniref:hypothetical protein n=1 Tax=Pseudomonas sp. NPDC089734 TaxID=3364469 RepID=UPI0037F79584
MFTCRNLPLLCLPLIAGCQFLPHSSFFKAPENEPNPAWVRIVNFTQHSAIYQEVNGVRTGGVIRRGELPFIHTQDKGMPKAGQDLTFDFYETQVRPGVETQVFMNWQGERTQYCFVTAAFTPKAGRYYQFEMTSGDSGTCTMTSTLVEPDKDGTGWHLSPNPDVTYPRGSHVGKTIYSIERYRDSSYKPFTPGM